MEYISFFQKFTSWIIIKIPLYLVPKGSKKPLSPTQKNTSYDLYFAFSLHYGRFSFSKNHQQFVIMAPQAIFFQNLTQKGNIFCLDRSQNIFKIGKHFKITLYLVLKGFKTPLYIVLKGSQNL